MTSIQNKAGAVDRLYILNGGFAVAPDRSVYTPGEGAGEQITPPCNAYLILRAGAWMLWDTGVEDAVERAPGGKVIAHAIRGLVVRTIAAQFADIGLTAADVGTVVLSHAHFDHVGNASLFRHAAWRIQRREHEAMFGPDAAGHGYEPSLYRDIERAKVELMDGDCDLFGDGSARVVSTPRHTPGHCSVLVRLPKTGPVLLSGDVAHFRANWERRRAPSMNADVEASRRSMDRVEAIVRAEKAQLWLNHDFAQTAALPHAPAFFD